MTKFDAGKKERGGGYFVPPVLNSTVINSVTREQVNEGQLFPLNCAGNFHIMEHKFYS